MQASKLITLLTEAIAENGDVDVTIDLGHGNKDIESVDSSIWTSEIIGQAGTTTVTTIDIG